jgi:outer membrane immunogenic protein
MKRTLVSFAALTMLSGAAFAADAAAVSGQWGGFYAGLNAGYGSGESNATPNGLLVNEPEFSVDFKGGLVGGQIGYDVDNGNGLIIGAVTDLSTANIDGDVCVEDNGCDGSPDDSYSSNDVQWLSTTRLRAGFSNGNMLFYGTGGIALAKVTADVTHLDDVNTPTVNDTNTHVGYAVGAGAEFMVSENMTIGAEYLHINLGEEQYYLLVDLDYDQGMGGASGDLTVNVIRATLNYRF